MRIHVRNIAAQCARCGGEDFCAVEGKRLPLASQTLMRCSACGTTESYVYLIMQIAEKALAASVASLEEIRRRRSK